MRDRPKELSSFTTPDTLRQFLNMMKHFYQLHTPRNRGSVDADGVHYVGTVENFGSELLFETHQLQSKKPPIGYLKISDQLQLFFDVQHSDFISTFDQQNMLCCLLKPDIMENGFTYDIVFDDVVDMYVYRAESTSDPVVRRDLFLYTTTTPNLQITSPEGDVSSTPLYVSDMTGNTTRFFFPINDATKDLIDVRSDADIQTIITNGTFTIHLNQHMFVNVPYIWFCVDDFKTLPDITIVGNSDAFNRPLLETGIDGHLKFQMFPLIQPNFNIPVEFVPYLTDPDKIQYLRVSGDFIQNNNPSNYNATISRIEYIITDGIGVEPAAVHAITCDDSFVKLHLSQDATWHFRKPQEGDYDYDGATYDNPVYAYIELNAFEQNSHDDAYERKDLLSAFVMEVDDEHIISPIEVFMNHTVTGVHIDDSCEQSQNSVDKTHGVIHHLGEFDGLPRSFATWLDRETHRAHVELYTIRDRVDTTNPTKYQTAAVIVDSGVPQTDMNDILDDLTVTIKYDEDGVFNVDGESESYANWLSDNVYLGGNDIAADIDEYESRPHFVYHMNGIFSLSKMGLDPEMEYGRVYAVTNDPVTYVNNELASHPKAPLCIARICDIPTSYIQLTHIPGHAPTFALDPSYIRQQASYNETLKNIVLNDSRAHCLMRLQNHMIQMVFADSDDLDAIFAESTAYGTFIHLNESLNMSDPSTDQTYTFTVLNGGADYVVGSRFTTIIGGVNFDGEVTSVNGGVVDGISMDAVPNRLVNVGNLDELMECKTTTIQESGSGLKLLLTIDNSTYNALLPTYDPTELLENLYAFKFDEFGNIWIWEYDGTNWVKSTQLTGESPTNNRYDVEPEDHTDAWNASYITEYPWTIRSLTDVYLYNYFYGKRHDFTPFHPDVVSYATGVISSDGIVGWNYPETYYIIDGSDLYYTTITETDEWELLPSNHQLNSYVSERSTNMLQTVETESQPKVFVYDPMLENVSSYTEIMDNVFSYESSYPITVATRFGQTFISSNVLMCDLYGYTYQNNLEALRLFEQSLLLKTREELFEIVMNHYGESSDPVVAEETDFKYDKKQLIDYICQRSYSNPIYNQPGISLIREQGEQVIEDDGSPVGKQPIGGTIPVQDTYNTHVSVNGSGMRTIPTYVFRIDGISDLTGFRMYDDQDNDISEHCILVVGTKLFAFNTTENDWMQIGGN